MIAKGALLPVCTTPLVDIADVAEDGLFIEVSVPDVLEPTVAVAGSVESVASDTGEVD